MTSVHSQSEQSLSVHYQKDSDNIVHLVLDKPDSAANLMDDEFVDSLQAAVEQLQSDDFAGVILRSNKKTFFAGGDLDSLFKVTPDTADQLWDMGNRLKAAMRALETCGKPVVACINGAALGGGWELALTAHHRICLSQGVQLGLPEVTLGLLPGGGGVIRMVRLLGLQGAMPFLTEGRQFKPQQGVELGLVQELADDADDMLAKAKAWIAANPEAQQPWDQKGYKMPGGKPSHPALAQMLPIVPAIMRAQTKGVMPAPESILAVMVEGAQVDFDTACRIESRYFVELVAGKVSKNMINTFWYQLNEIKAGARRPDGVAATRVKKVGVLGAGMMGAGIAYAAASKGITVVLKDISVENAEKGKAYSQKILQKRVDKGRMAQDKMDATLALITATDNAEDLNGCDLIIEAVFEDRDLKAKVTQEAEPQLAEGGVFASNTSTIPITGLAQAASNAEKFIGLHFFSPVDKMPLVEIICGEQTSDDTLARAYDFVQQIGKTPIVVNDSRGFYTSRVFGTYSLEGIAMLAEGIPAAAVENGAFLSGFPVGPLAVTDEVTLTLVAKIRAQEVKDLEAEGKRPSSHPAYAIVDRMLEQERAGKAAGAGFYDYPAGGKKHLWSGLKEQFEKADASYELQDIKDRLLYRQAIETVRCVEEGVLESSRDANIGSIMGIGFPPWTGGTLQFINYVGLPEFIARAEQLTEQFGERFEPPQLLREMAEKSQTFKD